MTAHYRSTRFHRVTLSAACAVMVVIFAQPALTQTYQQSQNFQLVHRHGDPVAVSWEWTWSSPNLIPILINNGVDADRLLTQANKDIDWLLSQLGLDAAWLLGQVEITAGELLTHTGKDVDWLLTRLGENVDWLLSESGQNLNWLLSQTGLTASQILHHAGKDADWLLARAGHDIDWLLSKAGKTLAWLLTQTNATAGQLLQWAGKDVDWLLDQMGKDADWLLDKSGKSVSWLLGRAGKGASWVAGRVKNLLCGGLDGYAKTACETPINAIAGSISKLVDYAGKSADWWLGQAGKDADWLLTQSGRSADWLLGQANKDKSWLMGRLAKDADWLLQQAGRDADWLLTQAGKTSDWLLPQTGKSLAWLLGQAGATASALLQWAGKDADWLLERLGKSAGWVLTQSGKGIVWLIGQTGTTADLILQWANKDADWLIEQLGWRLADGDLRATATVLVQHVERQGFVLGYAGTGRMLQSAPPRQNSVPYDIGTQIAQGRLNFAAGEDAFNANAGVTYVDPTQATVTAAVDPGVFVQDAAIIINDPRRPGSRTRHNDGWLFTVCIPVSEAGSAITSPIPPVAALVLALVPDVMIQVNGDVGITLSGEEFRPTPGRAQQLILSTRQRTYRLPVRYTTNMDIDARLNAGSWGFAWGIVCGPGVSISFGQRIPGGYTLHELPTLSLTTQDVVEFTLAPQVPGPPQPGPRPQPVPRPGTQPTPQQPVPQPVPQTVPTPEPQPTPPPPQTQSAQPVPVQPVQPEPDERVEQKK